MAADINTQDLFFKSQLELFGILADIRHRDHIVLFVLLVRKIEQRELTRHIVLAGVLKVIHHPHIDAHELLAGGAEAVQRAGLDEVLDDSLINFAVL